MIARRAIRLLLVLIGLFLGAALPAVAEQAAPPASLTVSMDDNYPPYVFRNQKGAIDGYLVDLWHLWEEKTGVAVKLEATDWAKAQNLLAQGKADVIDTIFRTPQRDNYLEFSKPYADLPVAIYAHQDIGGITDTASLRGFLVAAKAGDACIDMLRKDDVGNLAIYDSYEKIIDEAASGRVKLFCLDEPPANYLLYRKGADRSFRKAFSLYSGQFHRAVNKGNGKTLDLVQQGFDAITPAELQKVQDKWMGSPLGLPLWWRYLSWGFAVVLLIAGSMVIWGLMLRRQVRHRTRELEDEKSRLRTLVNTLPDLVWLKNPEGLYLACNREFELLFGAQEADILGRSDYDFVPHELADFFRSKDLAAIAAGRASINEEEVAYASDGHCVLLETIKTPMYDSQGKLIGVLGIGRDITARRQVEQAIAESQERFMVAFRSSPVSASIARAADGCFVDANDNYLRDFGWSRDEILGKTSLEIGLWPSSEVRQNWLAAIRGAGKVVDYETDWLDRQGRPRKVSISATLIQLNGEPHLLAFITDITERKRIEAELRDREAYNKVLFAESHIPLVVLDPESGRYVDCNAAAVALYALPDRQAVLGLSFLDVSAPFQYDGSDSATAALQRIKTALEQGAQLFEWRHRRPNGQEWDGEVHLMRIVHGDQAFLQFSLVDITQRKQNEATLRLAGRVFESTAEGIVMTDAAGQIVAVNKAFTEITGYAESDAIGQNPRFLRSGKHNPMFYQELWSSLLEAGVWKGEIWNRRKNGEVYPNWETISTVKDKDGRTTHYVAVFSDITAVKRSQEALDFLAHHDPLTELPNRLLLRDRLEHALLRSQRDLNKLAVLFLDLDRFKHINDTLGHPVGDEILRLAARAMLNQVRSSDTIARIGGDEFIILLEDDVSVHSVATVARKLVDLFAQPFTVAGRELYVTASVGISLYPNDGDDVDRLLRNADLAMYKAKTEGRNNYQFYESEMGAGALERLIVENALRGAVQRNELFLHYQPQVDLATGALAGVEALVRWQHPDLGLVPPGRFIPVAEEMGAIGEIGDWVLKEACQQIARWRENGFVVPRMAINISMQQLEKEGLTVAVAQELENYAIPASQLELEVTESVIMRQTGRALELLDGLRKEGVYLAIDDFGTGYSSLGYLRELPVHRLKIDSSFVRDIGRDENDEAIARAIISLGHSLGLEIVAEGVEREEQAAFLRAEACDVAQGFLYARPVPADELEIRWNPPGGPRCK